MNRKVMKSRTTAIQIKRNKNAIIKNVIQLLHGNMGVPSIVAFLQFVVIHSDFVILVRTIVAFETFITLVGIWCFL